MSGIIGGAGSKSGVIGTTELDYEEGTLTITGTNVTSNSGRYTKIGNVVTVTFRFTASGGTMTNYPGGLPFTSESQVSSEKPGGGSVIFHNQDSNTWNAYVFESNTTFAFYKGDTQSVLTDGATAMVCMTYISV